MVASEGQIQRCARVIGDGGFVLPVVGAAAHQADLEILAGGRSEEGALKLCAALLQPRPDNPDGEKVSVIVHSCTVGYLAPDMERPFLAALKSNGFANAACEAVIFGGRRHGGEEDSQFGIKLNVALPFKLADPVVRAKPALPPVTRASVPRESTRPEPPWARYAEPPLTRPEPAPQPATRPEPVSQPATRPEPVPQPSPAAEPLPAEPPPQPTRVEPPPQPVPAAPPPHGPQTHVFRTEEYGRGFFGWIFLAALVVFNFAMAVWLIAYWTGLFELADVLLTGGEMETKIGPLLGLELIFAIWIAGAVLLGPAAYVTRGKTVVVDEIVESPAAPTP